MLRSQFGAGYAIVPVPEDLNPDHGNVIRRGSGKLVPAHGGNFVERTPNTLYRDAESGEPFMYPPNSTQRFLPDGRLVARDGIAEDGLFGTGLAGPFDVPLPWLMFGGGFALSAVAGAMLSKRGRRARGALTGFGIGAVTLFGAAVVPWLYQKMRTA